MKKLSIEIIYLVLLFCIITIILVWLYHDANINYAMVNPNIHGDVKYIQYTIRNTCEFGWFFENPRMDGGVGALYSHSMGDFIQYTLVRLMGLFTDNFDLIYNLFYFCTYFICAGAMYFVSRMLKLSPFVSTIQGLIFAFIPWHQIRMFHLMSSMFYAAIPIAVLVGIWIADGEIEGDRVWKVGGMRLNRKYVFVCGLTLLSALTDIIWSAFNCYVLAIAIIVSTFRNKKIKVFLKSFFILIVEVIGTLTMYIPAFVYYWKMGFPLNAVAFNRNPVDAQTFGMKILNLFLPRVQHRIQTLADMNEIYQNYTGSHEGAYVSLGIVVCAGFVFLILTLFRNESNTKKQTLALLNVSVVLIATVGGIGAIVAYIIPTIRTYNRMSLYIAVFSIIYLGMLADNILCDKERHIRKWFVGLIICVAGVAIFDSTATYDASVQEDIIADKDKTEAFIKQIEDIMPEGSKIYQVPYTFFPEAGYDLLDGYLYSDALVWSFGSVRGTDNDLWQSQLRDLPLEELCEQIVMEGYTGLYVDILRLNESPAYDSNTFIQKMNEIALREPIYNADYTLYFYDLRDWADNFLENKSKEELDRDRIPTIDYTKGFSEQYTDADGQTLRWCDGKGIVTVDNRSSVERVFEIAFYADSYANYDNEVRVLINGERWKYNISGNHEYNVENRLSFSVSLPPGKNEITFESSLNPVGNPKGIIERTFCIRGLAVLGK